MKTMTMRSAARMRDWDLLISAVWPWAPKQIRLAAMWDAAQRAGWTDETWAWVARGQTPPAWSGLVQRWHWRESWVRRWVRLARHVCRRRGIRWDG